MNIFDNVEEAVELYNAGETFASVGRKYGCDRKTASDVIRKSGFPLRNNLAVVLGPIPQEGEKAIYYLRHSDGKPYYVGSTDQPTKRLNSHKFRQDNKDIEMVIVRLCVAGNEIYWESKLLVELIDAGFDIINQTAPVKHTNVESKKKAPIVHGTLSGLSKHKRQGEDPCEECKGAQSEYSRTRYLNGY